MFGIFKKQRVDLCSKVQGQLFVSGHPAKGVRIHRILTYSGEQEFSDSTVTGSEGCFSLPKYSILSRKPNKPFFESFVHQYIYAEHNSENMKLWFATRPGKDDLRAFEKKLGTMRCDLTDPVAQFEFDSGFYNVKMLASGKCRWQSDFKIIDNFAESSDDK